MAVYKISHAFDISNFSRFLSEKEWLLAPGSEFQEAGRTQLPTGPLGIRPSATEWWQIEYAQTKVPLVAHAPRVPRGFRRG
jgi:hypothetical protein